MLSAIEKTQFNQDRTSRLGRELCGKVHVVKAVYDFAVDGGATGDHNLSDEEGNLIVIPSGAIVKQVIIDEVTAVTGADSIDLNLNTGNDLLNAKDFTGVSGLAAGIPVSSAATAVKATADRQLTLSINTNAMTAGKLHIYLEVLFVPVAA